jgi:hypothetical protein
MIVEFLVVHHQAMTWQAHHSRRHHHHHLLLCHLLGVMLHHRHHHHLLLRRLLGAMLCYHHGHLMVHNHVKPRPMHLVKLIDLQDNLAGLILHRHIDTQDVLLLSCGEPRQAKGSTTMEVNTLVNIHYIQT